MGGSKAESTAIVHNTGPQQGNQDKGIAAKKELFLCCYYRK
jgi:hypothetical protein